MLTEKCKNCVSCGRKKPWIVKVFQYFNNKEKIRNRSIIVQVIVIRTPHFDYWCDNELI